RRCDDRREERMLDAHTCLPSVGSAWDLDVSRAAASTLDARRLTPALRAPDLALIDGINLSKGGQPTGESAAHEDDDFVYGRRGAAGARDGFRGRRHGSRAVDSCDADVLAVEGVDGLELCDDVRDERQQGERLRQVRLEPLEGGRRG